MNMGTVTNRRELSLQAKRIVETIDNFLKELPTEEEIRKNYFEAENLLTLIGNIRRIKKELKTDRFVVIICGGLKSGKSTLINLLCHKEVSPTRLGRETTIRPCIFSDGDISRVLLFYGIAESETRRKDLFHAIIDYIKGIIDSKELKDIGLEIEEKPISEAVYWLTEENKTGSRSPIFVNVQIGRKDLGGKYNLLSEKILFIDTPGVDGITAGIGGRRDKENENLNVSWLAERVDLMLLLQSTVSPLNNSSINFIEKLYKDLNAPPILLIHNEFSLKCWRRDYKEMKEDSDADKSSIDNAKRLLRQKLGQNIECLRVNLGMAEDGFKFDRKELLEKSGFIDFEENFYKFIVNNRRQIHEENVFNKLRRLKEKNLNPAFRKNEETDNIGYIRDRIKKEKEKLEEEKKKYLDILSDIKWIFNYEKCKVSSGIIEEY
jgi:predicted GTPase